MNDSRDMSEARRIAAIAALLVAALAGGAALFPDAALTAVYVLDAWSGGRLLDVRGIPTRWAAVAAAAAIPVAAVVIDGAWRLLMRRVSRLSRGR